MHAPRTAALIALAVLASGGCAALDDVLDGIDKPTASIVGVDFAGLDARSVTLDFQVRIDNPYEVDLPVLGLDYALASAGATFLTGSTDGGAVIPAAGSHVMSVPARISFAEALSLVSGISPGDIVPYEADLGVSVDAPAIGNLRLPLAKTGEFPIPTVPRVSVGGVKWDIGLSGASAVLDLDIVNDNRFAVDLEKLAYDLKLAGTPVVRSGATRSVSFDAGDTERMTLNFDVTVLDVGRAVFGMFSGNGADYELGGTMDLATPFGPISLPYSGSGHTPFTR